MKYLSLTLATAAAMSLAACSGTKPDAANTSAATDQPSADATPAPAGTIVDVVKSNPNFATLLTAVKAADLGSTLSGPGPFTVFAPTDAAFAKLPDGTLADLTKPENKDKLAAILTYHVIAGDDDATVLAGLIKDGKGTATLTTVNGEKLTAKMAGDTIQLTDAKGNTAMVTATDIRASNGVVHVIDNVLMP